MSLNTHQILKITTFTIIQQLRQESNLHDHSWSRDFPTTLAFTQANLYQYFYLYKLLWSGLFYYHIRNLASKYIRFILTSNSSLLFLISATVASLILYIQFLTWVSPLQSLHIYEYTNIKNFVFKLINISCLVSEDINHFLYVLLHIQFSSSPPKSMSPQMRLLSQVNQISEYCFYNHYSASYTDANLFTISN